MIYIHLGLIILFGIVGATSTQAGLEGGFPIRGYLGTGESARHIVIEAGRTVGVTSGEIFRVVRPARGGITTPIETGLAKVIAVHELDSIAEVITQGTLESQAAFGVYSDVMAGDVAQPQRLVIARVKSLAPEIVIRYSELFDDPKALPTTFEMTPGGLKVLGQRVEELSALKAAMLMVEGHTDQRGQSEQGQIESYQRAMTIRQHLIDDFGFDPARVTAIGLGESEPVSKVLLPGNKDLARRIVLKVVPLSN